MDIFEAILTRRSVRQYTSHLVPKKVVKRLLSAAMQAPSAGNQQPWHFIVVTRREQLNAMAEVLPKGKMLAQAPLGIMVCADTTDLKHQDYWVQDCAAATQNLLLAAHASGLGAVWLGVYPRGPCPESHPALSATRLCGPILRGCAWLPGDKG